MFKLLSDQVDSDEIKIILRELNLTLKNGIDGDVVEFGCYVGTTSVFLADILKSTDKTLYVYDSFEGLPDKTTQDESPLGEQFKAGELKAAKKQLISNFKKSNLPLPVIKKAWFNELQSEDVPDKIALAFLDGDYYESINDSLKLIEDKLNQGAIIVVDDYASEALPGAKLAVDNWLKTHPHELKVEKSLAIIYS